MQDESITSNPLNTHSPVPTTTPETTTDEPQKCPPEACLFVANLTGQATEDGLADLFQPFGAVLKIKLISDAGSRPYAFVQFATEDEAQQAMQAVTGQVFFDRPLRVEKAKVNRTLFVAKLPKDCDAQQLRDAMAPYGAVESASIIKNHTTGASRGCGFVKFAFREDAAQALQEIKAGESRWVVEWAKSNQEPDTSTDKQSIFIGGLNMSEATEAALEARFQSYGKLESVTLIARGNELEAGSPQPRNAYAFLRYEDAMSATEAIAAENGAEWLGGKIKVQYCESKETKNRRRQKQMRAYHGMYDPAAGYYGMPVVFVPGPLEGAGPEMAYGGYYPMYYNAPWPGYQMPIGGWEAPPSMMPNGSYPAHEELDEGYPSWNQESNVAPSVVPVLPWLP